MPKTEVNTPLPKPDDRVFISQLVAGFRAMQVCVLEDVPDEEILAVCNAQAWRRAARFGEGCVAHGTTPVGLRPAGVVLL